VSQLLVAGGGMGGLAAAVAAQRAGWQVWLLEQAAAFGEVGAGLQLGPNATRILREWKLLVPLAPYAAFPQRLLARDALGGGVLAGMVLGQDFERRYKAPYATVHRADLHGVLLEAARESGAVLRLDARVLSASDEPQGVCVGTECGRELECDALLGADGLWSAVRDQLLHDGPPRPTGHVAYRAVVRQADLPAGLRSNDVTAWMGPRMHLVSYPVRGGDWLNIAAFTEGGHEGDPRDWEHEAGPGGLHEAVEGACGPLRELVHAVPAWRLWVLHDRPPVQGAWQMARGRIALLGDAAHPMRPYLAQGAGMAIEDAWELGRSLASCRDKVLDVETALQRYALGRWQRCARVQQRSLRNGRIFHMAGPLRWGRDASLRLLGPRLLDLPWLYG